MQAARAVGACLCTWCQGRSGSVPIGARPQPQRARPEQRRAVQPSRTGTAQRGKVSRDRMLGQVLSRAGLRSQRGLMSGQWVSAAGQKSRKWAERRENAERMASVGLSGPTITQHAQHANSRASRAGQPGQAPVKVWGQHAKATSPRVLCGVARHAPALKKSRNITASPQLASPVAAGT